MSKSFFDRKQKKYLKNMGITHRQTPGGCHPMIHLDCEAGPVAMIRTYNLTGRVVGVDYSPLPGQFEARREDERWESLDAFIADALDAAAKVYGSS